MPHGGVLYGADDLDADCTHAEAFDALRRLLPQQAVWLTSTLRRTRQTAAAVDPARADGAAAESDLIEQHFGRWQGRRFDEIKTTEADAYHRFWITPAASRPPGGETFEELVQRVHGAIRRLTDEHRGRDIVAFGHGGPIRAAVGLALGLDAERMLAFRIDNLSITRIDHFEPHEDPRSAPPERHPAWRVTSVNLSPYLWGI